MHIAKRGILRGMIFLAYVLLIVPVNFSVSLAYDYIATSIEPLSNFEMSKHLGINNQGEVVGRFYNDPAGIPQDEDRQAFIWDNINGAFLLNTSDSASSTWDINDFGQASGYCYTLEGNQHAVFWRDVDTVVEIGILTDPNTGLQGESSRAHGINNESEVVGKADVSNANGGFMPFHAFLYNELNGIRDIGTLTTQWPQWQNGYSIAYGINNHGDVVGTAHDSTWSFLPFIYNDTKGMQALPRDPNYINGEWYAVAINDSGHIGGHVMTSTNRSLPYYWENPSTQPIPITMISEFPYAEIYGMNEPGQMVGMMWNSDQEDAIEHAFIFDDVYGIRDLNDLIDPNSGWILVFARDINDSGQIVGFGILNGSKRGFILTPSSHMDQDYDGYTPLEGDCNDDNPFINSGAEEICDGKDDNCNGMIDEKDAERCKIYYKDKDEDGYGVAGGRCLCNPDILNQYTAMLLGDEDDQNPEITADTATVTLQLDAGWSMISLPIVPEDATVSVIFPEAKAVFGFATRYILLEPSAQLEPLKGYWIYLPGAQNYAITGKPIEHYTIKNAPMGWAMIGACAFPSRPSIANGFIRALFGFADQYILIEEDTPLQPGKGYWINLSEQTDLRLEKR